MATPELIARMVAIMGETWNRKISGSTIDAYVFGLSDLEDEKVKGAVMRAIRESKFMPSPAELRELAGVSSHEDAGLQAWTKVVDAIGRYGSYRHIDFGPFANAAIRSMGGWPELCAKTGEELDVWARKAFISAYASFARSGVTGEICQPVAGLASGGAVRNIEGKYHVVDSPEPICLTDTPTPRLGRNKGDDPPRIDFKKP